MIHFSRYFVPPEAIPDPIQFSSIARGALIYCSLGSLILFFPARFLCLVITVLWSGSGEQKQKQMENNFRRCGESNGVAVAITHKQTLGHAALRIFEFPPERMKGENYAKKNA